MPFRPAVAVSASIEVIFDASVDPTDAVLRNLVSVFESNVSNPNHKGGRILGQIFENVRCAPGRRTKRNVNMVQPLTKSHPQSLFRARQSVDNRGPENGTSTVRD